MKQPARETARVGHTADFEVQPAVVTEQLEQPLSAAPVQLADAALAADHRQRFRAEVELVVGGHEQARTEGAQGPRDARGVELVVEEIACAEEGREDEEAAGPAAGAAEGAGGAGRAEGGRGGRAKGLEGAGGVGYGAADGGGEGAGGRRCRCRCPRAALAP